MMKFNGERWELFGPILEDKGRRASRGDPIETIGGKKRSAAPRGRRFFVVGWVERSETHHSQTVLPA